MTPEACAIAEQQQWLRRLRIEKWPEKIVGTRARANRKFSHLKYGVNWQYKSTIHHLDYVFAYT